MLVKKVGDTKMTNNDGRFAKLLHTVGKKGTRILFRIAYHKYKIEKDEEEKIMK